MGGCQPQKEDRDDEKKEERLFHAANLARTPPACTPLPVTIGSGIRPATVWPASGIRPDRRSPRGDDRPRTAEDPAAGAARDAGREVAAVGAVREARRPRACHA